MALLQKGCLPHLHGYALHFPVWIPLEPDCPVSQDCQVLAQLASIKKQDSEFNFFLLNNYEIVK